MSRIHLRHEDLPYRPCVGVMLINREGLVFVGRRIGGELGRQFPAARARMESQARQRLGRDVVLSARPADNAALEDFMAARAREGIFPAQAQAGPQYRPAVPWPRAGPARPTSAATRKSCASGP